MKKDDDSREVTGEVVQTLSQVFIGALAVAVAGGDPYVAGAGVLTSQLTSLWGKMKINRVEKFTLSFVKYLNSIHPNLDWTNTNNEDFSIFFEKLLVHVSSTTSLKKLKCLRNIAVNQILTPKDFDVISKYMEIISKLSEQQIVILTHLYTEEKAFKHADNRRIQIVNVLADPKKTKNTDKDIIERYQTQTTESLNSLKNEKNNMIDLMNRISGKRKPLFQTFEVGEFDFLINDLKSFGLLWQKVGGSSFRGVGAFTHMEITEFGENLYEFIKS